MPDPSASAVPLAPALAPGHLDHLVVLAPDLDSGVRWCEQTLGVTPGPGGAHPLMGTHNRLLPIEADGFPKAYLEIIAVDERTIPTRAIGLKRWFDLDDPALMARLRREGPMLGHWVGRTGQLHPVVQAWRELGLERGPVLSASRQTPQGLLQWQITVRDDGARLLDGALPTLIQWGDVHPCSTMASSPLKLRHLHLRHPESDRLSRALALAGLLASGRVTVEPGSPLMVATLDAPRGEVNLSSAL